MKKEDWEKAKSRLRAPLGQVDLLCDGYSVTLINECISMFRNGIAVYVNGEIRGSWSVSYTHLDVYKRQAIGVTPKSFNNKLAGKSPFTWPEVQTIQKRFFPDMNKDDLFQQ